MVKLSFCLDRPDHKYNPGDVINVTVRVQVNSDTKFRSIYVRIKGYAHVEFTDVGDNGQGQAVAITFRSHETFFKNYQTLAGTRAGV